MNDSTMEAKVIDRSAYMTADEVAEILGKSRMTITRWIKADVFPGAFKDGPTTSSPWLIPKSAVENYQQGLLRNTKGE